MCFITFLFLPIMVPVFAIPACKNLLSHRTDRSIYEKIFAVAQNAELVCLGCFPPGMPFYSKKLVTVFSLDNAREIKSNYIQYTLSTTLDWPHQIKRFNTLDNWLVYSNGPVFLIARDNEKPTLQSIAISHHKILLSLGNDYYGFLLP